MFKTLVLSLMMLQSINNQCSKGCLRCTVKSATDSSKVCSLCDVLSSYYLKSDGSCAQSDLKNCVQILQDNTCGACDSGYFLDAGKCVAVDAQKKVANCQNYDQSQNCLICAEGYFISGLFGALDQCAKVNSPKANCSVHKTADECQECSKNYYLAEDKTCKAFPTDCLSFSLTQCRSCDAGFLMNMNQYRKSLTALETAQQKNAWWTVLNQVKNSLRRQKPMNLCEQVTATSCATYESFEQCASCASGFYLDATTKKCTVFPEPIIPNCKVYEFLSASKWQYKCAECMNLFRKQDDKTCVAQAIPDCVENDGTQTTDVCRRCKAGKKLNLNACSVDQAVIDGCSLYQADADKCTTCVAGKILNSDFTACKTPVANCSVHAAFNASSASLTCTTCSNGYIKNPDGTVCTKGTNVGCEVYSDDGTCTRCANKYHVAPSCSSQHQAITDCKVYSRLVTNTCLECENNKIPFVMTNRCKTHTPLTNCLQHTYTPNADTSLDPTWVCSLCKDMYYLDGANGCVSISSKTGIAAGCVQLNAAKDDCAKCETGKYLAKDITTGKQQCLSPNLWATSNCATQSTDINRNDHYCSVCNPEYYPVSISHCVLVTDLKHWYSTNVTPTLTNCLEYKDTVGCVKCKSTHYLKSDHTCAETCATTLVAPFAIKYVETEGVQTGTNFKNNFCDTVVNLLLGGTAPAETKDIPTPLLVGKATDGTTISYACRDSFYTIWKRDGKGTNLNYWKTTLNAQDVVFNIADQQQEVDCLQEFTSKETGTLSGTSAAAATAARVNGAAKPGTVPSQATGKDREIYQLKIDQNFSIDGAAGATDHDVYLTIACGWQKDSAITYTSIQETHLACSSDVIPNSTSTRLAGVPAQWSNLFNIHQCESSATITRIPVIAFVAETAIANHFKFVKFSEYTLGAAQVNIDTPESIVGTGKAVFCLDIHTVNSIKTGLQLTVADSSINAMQYCGLGFLNLDKHTASGTFNNIAYETVQSVDADYLAKSMLGCVACKPGYKSDRTAVPALANQKLARKCTAIPNCNQNESQLIFDACSKCNLGYTWGYTADNMIQFDTCVKVPEQLTNCLAFKQPTVGTDTTQGFGVCKICNAGFFLDKDGKCVQTTPLNCLKFQPFYTVSNNSAQNYLFQNGSSCQECSSDYIVFTQSTPLHQCLKMPTLASFSNKDLGIVVTDNQIRPQTDANFINRCLKYNSEGKCAECQANYILTEDKKICMLKSNNSDGLKLQNCKTAKNSPDQKSCKICDDGYPQTLNGCVQGLIANCMTYKVTEGTLPNPQCTACSSGYWLKIDGVAPDFVTTCEKGKILNCDMYKSETVCSKCLANFWLLKVDSSNEGEYCFPRDSSTNCSNVEFTQATDISTGTTIKLLSGTCVECDETYEESSKVEGLRKITTFMVNVRTSKCTALPSFPTNSCKTFAQSWNLDTNAGVYTFQCTECNTGFYLSADSNNYVCIARNADKNKDCETLQKSADKCSKCKTGFYLNALSDGCIAYPTGQYGCTTYGDALKCTACDVDHYLSNGVCVKVLTKVSNCSLYAADNKCSACQANHFMTTDILCEAVTPLLNCATYEAKDSCKTCPVNFKLVTTNGKNSCSAVTVAANCSTFNVTTEKCTQCAQYHYVNAEGTCTKVADDLIVGCLVMDSATTCSLCSKGRALSLDKKVCRSDSDLDANCLEGNVAATPVCSLCLAGYQFVNGKCVKNSYSTIEKGCYDEQNDKTCLMCIPGWSMLQPNECSDNNPAPVPAPPKSALIQAICWMIASLFFMQ